MNDMTIPGYLRPGILAVIVLIAASGCGMAEYERRMDAQRVRVQKYDEANRLLDDPIETPVMQLKNPKEGEKAEIPAWPYEIFLRLPKGYGSTPKEKTPYNDPFPCYRYTGGTEGALNIFVAAAAIMDPPKAETELKLPEDFAKYYAVNFRTYLRVALQKFYEKTSKSAFTLQEKGKPQFYRGFEVVAPYPDPDKPTRVTYTSYLYTDEGNPQPKDKEPSAFDVYIHEQIGKQVCIVVHRPLRPASAEMTKSIEACLGSLDVSGDAGNKRVQFKKPKAP
jgi:hypothetical protein